MFAIDAPNVPPNLAPIAVAQLASAARPGSNVDRTIGVCGLVENPIRFSDSKGTYSAANGISPLGATKNYLYSVENKDLRFPGTVTVLQSPQHGVLKDYPDNVGEYTYLPNDKYLGKDQAVFLVEVGGMKVEVHYFIRVLASVPEDGYEDKKYCPNGDAWKLTLTQNDLPAQFADFVSPISLLNYQLKQVDISLNFTNLANSAVGETVGHSITLDDDGAGHGWFIDATPELNDEFLPTSNPNEFIARPGSEAFGKMDLLTVLLHEYGHALGLDHDASTHQLMSEELQPGVRRSVSDAEMAKLWSLIGEPLVDASMGQPFPTVTGSATGIGGGSDPSAPFNPLPLSLSFMFGFARRRIDTSPAGQGIVLPPLSGNDPNAVTINPMLGAATFRMKEVQKMQEQFSAPAYAIHRNTNWPPTVMCTTASSA